MIFAIGAFDGFHLGHQKLLAKARERAEKIGAEWGVMTFSEHPQALFNRSGFKLLFTDDERDIITRYLNIPKTVKLPFTRAVANMSPREFLDFMARDETVDGLVAGENFRFGKVRTGTPELLAELCKERGWSLDVLGSYSIGNEIVSSTLIRESIIRGQVEKASLLLGYPFIICGKVIKGDGRGRSMGCATANLGVKQNKVYPARGSYGALAFVDGKWRAAALNIGFNPTFDGVRGLRCEAHIIDWEGDLYGQNLEVFCVARNREEVKFSSNYELREQLQKDIKNISAAVRSCAADHSGELDRLADSL